MNQNIIVLFPVLMRFFIGKSKMTNKLDIQEVNSRLEKKGFKLVEEYRGSHYKTNIKCFCGRIFQCRPDAIFNNKTKSCGHCNDLKINDRYWSLTVINVLSSKSHGCKVICRCDCGNLYTGISANITAGKIKSCGKCRYKILSNKFPKISQEWDYEKNDPLTPNEVKYCSTKIVWWKCNNGHSYKAQINSKTLMNSGCPFCSGAKVLKGFNDLLTTHPNYCDEWDYTKNIIKPTEVSRGSKKKVWWICQKGHSYNQQISTKTNQNQGCPICQNSKGEKEVERILTNLGIKYEKQKKYSECKNKRCLPFDFYLVDYNILIEYNGSQHYNVSVSENSIFDFDEIKRRDQIKRKFCKKNNIKLIEIKYTEYSNIEEILKLELGLGERK